MIQKTLKFLSFTSIILVLYKCSAYKLFPVDGGEADVRWEQLEYSLNLITWKHHKRHAKLTNFAYSDYDSWYSWQYTVEQPWTYYNCVFRTIIQSICKTKILQLQSLLRLLVAGGRFGRLRFRCFVLLVTVLGRFPLLHVPFFQTFR